MEFCRFVDLLKSTMAKVFDSHHLNVRSVRIPTFKAEALRGGLLQPSVLIAINLVFFTIFH